MKIESLYESICSQTSRDQNFAQGNEISISVHLIRLLIPFTLNNLICYKIKINPNSDMKPISRRTLKKLLREKSNDSSLSLSLTNNREPMNELSLDQMREHLHTRSLYNPQEKSYKTLQSLFKIFQTDNTTTIGDFGGCFVYNVADYATYISEFTNEFKTNSAEAGKKWYHLLSLQMSSKFDIHSIGFVNLLHTVLADRKLAPNPSLFLIYYLIISPFWKDFASLTIDKSNLIVQQLKVIIKTFTKIYKHSMIRVDSKEYSVYNQLVENVSLEIRDVLLMLFQIVKKKSSYYFCFIVLSEILEKLMKKNLMKALNTKDLNQLEINLNKKQKVIFDEIFLKQPDPLFDKHLVFKSTALHSFREELFNIYITYEYRNSISFTHLLYAFDTLHFICNCIEGENPKAFEKLLEFKVLVKTMAEIFEYFCNKLSNMNTEGLLMLDTHVSAIEYFVRFLSNKKKQELLNAYQKVNSYFDKNTSKDVEKLFTAVEFTKKEKIEASHRKKEISDYSEQILANLKLLKKEPDLLTRCLHTTQLLQEILQKSNEIAFKTKSKLKLAKSVLKLLKALTEELFLKSDIKQATEELLIVFLEIPFSFNKSIIEKLKEKYEILIKTHKFQGKPEIFKLIKNNLEKLFVNEDKKQNKPGSLSGTTSPSMVGLSRDTSNMEEIILSRETSLTQLSTPMEDYLINKFKPFLVSPNIDVTQKEFDNYWNEMKKFLTEPSNPVLENTLKKPELIDQAFAKLNWVVRNLIGTSCFWEPKALDKIIKFRQVHKEFLKRLGKEDTKLELYTDKVGFFIGNSVSEGVDYNNKSKMIRIKKSSELILKCFGFEKSKGIQIEEFERFSKTEFSSSWEDLKMELTKGKNLEVYSLTREGNLEEKSTIAIRFIAENSSSYETFIIPKYCETCIL